MTEKRIGVFFDGTNNDRERDLKNFSDTNVSRMLDLYTGDEKFYVHGVGTRKAYGTNWAHQALGTEMMDKVETALTNIKSIIKKNKDSFIYLDVFGFSRGATTARYFVNEVNAYINKNNLTKRVTVGVVGIYDTVEADNRTHGRDGNINLHESSAEGIVHLTAKDEKRDTFDLTKVTDKDTQQVSRIDESEMLGVHSDVGGGYSYDKVDKGSTNDIKSYKSTIGQKYAVERDETECFFRGDKFERAKKYAKDNKYNTFIYKKNDSCFKMEHRVYEGLSNVHMQLMIDRVNRYKKLFKKSGSGRRYSFNDETLKKYYGVKSKRETVPSNLALNIRTKFVHDSTLGFANFDTNNRRNIIDNDSSKAVPTIQTRVGIFFDGTGNQKDNDGEDATTTNITKLYSSYNDEKKYINGVGTRKLTSSELDEVRSGKKSKDDFYSTTDMAMGSGMKGKVEEALIQVKKTTKENPHKFIHIDIFGFSRGAAIARFFVNRVNKYINTNKLQRREKIGFVGIFDTVEADTMPLREQGNINLNNSSADKIVHLTSENEKRDNFSLTSMRNKDGSLSSNAEEIGGVGVHSDVGGGYGYEYIDKDGKQFTIEKNKVEEKCFNSHDESLLKDYAKKNNYTLGKISKRSFPWKRECAWMYNEHKVYKGLSDVYLKLMHTKAKKAGVNLLDIKEEDKIQDPRLKIYYKRLNENKTIPPIIEKYIKENYVHQSHVDWKNGNEDKRWIAHKASNNQRDIIFNKSNKAVKKEKYKLNPNRVSQNFKNLKSRKSKSSSNIINVNLENKSQKLFKKLGLKHEKIPTLNHNQNLPENIEGMYKKDKLSLKKNPRVSDKKAEAVAMHEIYHHTQKDKGLELGQEETQANMIEKAYLNESQESSEELDFDLIYAHTIKQFYEHEELEQLVRILGGDASSSKKVYTNAMYVISISESKKINNIGYENSTLKKVVGDSGVKYKDNTYKASFSDNVGNIVRNKELKDVLDKGKDIKDELTRGKDYLDPFREDDKCLKVADLKFPHKDYFNEKYQWINKHCTQETVKGVRNDIYDEVSTIGVGPLDIQLFPRDKRTDSNITTKFDGVVIAPPTKKEKQKMINKIILEYESAGANYATCKDWIDLTDGSTPEDISIKLDNIWRKCSIYNDTQESPTNHPNYDDVIQRKRQ